MTSIGSGRAAPCRKNPPQIILSSADIAGLSLEQLARWRIAIRSGWDQRSNGPVSAIWRRTDAALQAAVLARPVNTTADLCWFILASADPERLWEGGMTALVDHAADLLIADREGRYGPA